MNWIPFLITILFTTVTGWLIASILIKIIFRPIQKINIAGFKLQGVFPANQQLIAQKAGQIAAAQLFSFNDIEDKIADPRLFENLKPEMEKHIDLFLREKLKVSFPMISMFIGDKTINQLKNAFLTEVEELFPVMMKNYVGQLKEDINIEALISKKINDISPAQLETLLLQSAKKEISLIKWLGAFTGFMLGILQAIIIQLLR
ncbi:MAG: DUF445 domain-containing protein [Ferruginibacter sp.]